MTFPTGSPGGYQGQPQQGPGYAQPQQGPPYTPGRSGGRGLGIEEIIALAVAALGLITLFVGFAPRTPGFSFYDSVGSGWLPSALGIAGLLALLVVLPGNRDIKWGGLVAIVNIGAVLPTVFSLLVPYDTLAAGGIVLLIFAILQLIATVALYLFESGLLKIPAKPAYPAYGGAPGYGQPGGYGPPPGYTAPQGQQNPPAQNQPVQQNQPAQSGPQATQVFGAGPQQPYPQPNQPGPANPQGPGTPPGGFDGGTTP